MTKVDFPMIGQMSVCWVCFSATIAVKINPNFDGKVQNMHRFFSRSLFCVVFVMLSVAGCDTRKDYSADIEAIYQVLDVRQQAVSNKDLSLYESIIFSEYSEYGAKRELVLEDMKLTFERYPDIELKMPRIRPDVTRNTARIMQSSFYRSSADQPVVQIKETLMFRQIDGRWFISGGIVLGLTAKLKK